MIEDNFCEGIVITDIHLAGPSLHSHFKNVNWFKILYTGWSLYSYMLGNGVNIAVIHKFLLVVLIIIYRYTAQ